MIITSMNGRLTTVGVTALRFKHCHQNRFCLIEYTMISCLKYHGTVYTSIEVVMLVGTAS